MRNEDGRGKLADTSAAEVREGGLSWGDFDEGDADAALETVREQCRLMEAGGGAGAMDWNLAEKVESLLSNAGNELIDHGFHSADFYCSHFTAFALEAVADYDPGSPQAGMTAMEYDRSYSGLNILVEDLGSLALKGDGNPVGMFAAYVKDYSLGYIRPLGKCVYEYLPADEPDGAAPGYQIERRVIPCLTALILAGEIDLDREIYDYYHVIPDTRIPFVEDSLNELITVQEAAEILGVSSARVKKMVADRVLDGFKRDGRVWLAKAAVEKRAEYIAEHGTPKRGKGRK